MTDETDRRRARIAADLAEFNTPPMREVSERLGHALPAHPADWTRADFEAVRNASDHLTAIATAAAVDFRVTLRWLEKVGLKHLPEDGRLGPAADDAFAYGKTEAALHGWGAVWDRTVAATGGSGGTAVEALARRLWVEHKTAGKSLFLTPREPRDDIDRAILATAGPAPGEYRDLRSIDAEATGAALGISPIEALHRAYLLAGI